MRVPDTENNELIFVHQLADKLNENADWQVETEPRDTGADIVVRNANDKKIYIEIKRAGQYGELPISSILSVNDQVKRIAPTDNLILVTFSGISDFLNKKLSDINVTALSQPSVDDVVNKVALAMSA